MIAPDYAQMHDTVHRAVLNKRAHVDSLARNPKRQHEVSMAQDFLADLEDVLAFFAYLLQRRAEHQKTTGSTS